jgi:hypothetical protein
MLLCVCCCYFCDLEFASCELIGRRASTFDGHVAVHLCVGMHCTLLARTDGLLRCESGVLQSFMMCHVPLAHCV